MIGQAFATSSKSKLMIAMVGISDADARWKWSRRTVMGMESNRIIIKPCPFCNGKAGVYQRYDVPPMWSVACTKCGTEPPLPYGSYEYAVNQWNRRAFLGLWRERPKSDGGHHMVLDED